MSDKLTGCECKHCVVSPHSSDCAVHNGPALPAGPCDCAAKLGPVWCEECHALFTPNTDQDTLCTACFETPSWGKR